MLMDQWVLILKAHIHFVTSDLEFLHFLETLGFIYWNLEKTKTVFLSYSHRCKVGKTLIISSERGQEDIYRITSGNYHYYYFEVCTDGLKKLGVRERSFGECSC